MKTQTKEIQDNLSPAAALKMLKEGNERFLSNIKEKRNLQVQVDETSIGQYPFAVVLGCIDSRVPIELIFDQGIGDVFSARVAGNVVNEDVLGSLEYSCKVAGSKLVVVLGHTKCGAVTAACNNVELGNITHLLNKIKPSVNAIRKSHKLSGEDKMSDKIIEEVTDLNVQLSIENIRNGSPILVEMEKNNEIEIVGALYDVSTGKVDFL